jgi:E3 ubiquitin-protein ligase RNF13
VNFVTAFHQKCIDPWLTKNKRTCPLCKKKAFARPGNSSHSDSDDSAEDGYVSRRSSERTPLLSARDTATRPSTDYGLRTLYLQV